MKYMGSKAKHADEILEAIMNELSYPNRLDIWTEPFVGGGSMIVKVKGAKIRIGNDINPFLIKMFQCMQQKSWLPPDRTSEEVYQALKQDSKNGGKLSPEHMARIGFTGIGCSYSGKWFGGYARGNDNKGNPRNYCLESKKNLLNDLEELNKVQWYSVDYKNLYIPENSIVYCDPPYAGTTKYEDSFNTFEFWNWCDELVKKGHKVFVSEYNAPKDWRCIWEKNVNSSLTKETGSKKATEKLFTK